MDDLPKVSSVVYDTSSSGTSGVVTKKKCVVEGNSGEVFYIPATAQTTANNAAITYSGVSRVETAPPVAETTDSKKINQIFTINIIILLIVIVSLIMHIFGMFMFRGKSMDQRQSLY